MTVVFAATVGGRFAFDIKIILLYVGGAYHILGLGNIRKYITLRFRNDSSDRSVGCKILHKQIKSTVCIIYLNFIALDKIIW